MSTLRPTLRYRFLQVSALAAWPLLLAAAPGACDQDLRGPPPRPGPPGGADFGPFGFDDGSRPPPFLRDLSLNEAQQDKVFAIVHAAAPMLRNQSKAVMKSRDALRELVASAQFSDTAAKTLADAEGAAQTQLAFTRARMEHDVYAVLTPEQQALLAKQRPEWQTRRGCGPGPGPGPGPRPGPGA